MYLIGIDCGSTMVKAALFDETGKEYASAGRKIEHIYKHPGWTENDMNALWKSVCEVLTEIAGKTSIRAGQIACITCTGHGNGLYLVGEDGQPVRNGIISSDNRARKYIEEWTANDVLDKILPKTMQSIWAAQPNALLRWLIDNEPETIRRTKYVFMVKDYIRYKLTGEAYMELSDMSATSLMNTATGEYDDDVLAAWDLLNCPIKRIQDILPPLKKSADICGKIKLSADILHEKQGSTSAEPFPGAVSSAAASNETCDRLTSLLHNSEKSQEKNQGIGIPAELVGVPVAGGNFDIDSCGLAVGMTDETTFCMVAGTWGNNQFITSKPIIDRDIFMASCYSVDGYWLVLEGSPTSASNLEWFVREWSMTYDEVNQLVAATDASADAGIAFIPYLYGNPVNLDAKSGLFGLDGRHSKKDIMRAVYEGIVFGHRWHCERLFRFREKPKTIRLTGGAVNSAVWAQMFADILQIPVEIPAGTELGCFGAAICGAVAAEIYPTYAAACEAMVKIDRRFEPNKNLAAVYEKKYQRFLKLLDVFAPVWGELATVS